MRDDNAMGCSLQSTSMGLWVTEGERGFIYKQGYKQGGNGGVQGGKGALLHCGRCAAWQLRKPPVSRFLLLGQWLPDTKGQRGKHVCGRQGEDGPAGGGDGGHGRGRGGALLQDRPEQRRGSTCSDDPAGDKRGGDIQVRVLLVFPPNS